MSRPATPDTAPSSRSIGPTSDPSSGPGPVAAAFSPDADGARTGPEDVAGTCPDDGAGAGPALDASGVSVSEGCHPPRASPARRSSRRSDPLPRATPRRDGPPRDVSRRVVELRVVELRVVALWVVSTRLVSPRPERRRGPTPRRSRPGAAVRPSGTARVAAREIVSRVADQFPRVSTVRLHHRDVWYRYVVGCSVTLEHVFYNDLLRAAVDDAMALRRPRRVHARDHPTIHVTGSVNRVRSGASPIQGLGGRDRRTGPLRTGAPRHAAAWMLAASGGPVGWPDGSA
jgi:hypothetical protein